MRRPARARRKRGADILLHGERRAPARRRARLVRATRTEAGAADAPADARGSARPPVSRRAALAAARCSVRVATAASVVVMAPRRASVAVAVRASGTSARLLLACPSVSACAALSAARARCDASDGPSRFQSRLVRAFPLTRNPRAGALVRSEERRQQGPPPQVRAHVPARSRRRAGGGPPRATEAAAAEQARLVRSGPPRELRGFAPGGRRGGAPSLHHEVKIG